MIGWHDLVEIKRIKELALSAVPPTHHEPLPPMPVSNSTESLFVGRSMGVLLQNRVKSGNASRTPGTEAVAFWSGRMIVRFGLIYRSDRTSRRDGTARAVSEAGVRSSASVVI
jgi:hypothetical protein